MKRKPQSADAKGLCCPNCGCRHFDTTHTEPLRDGRIRRLLFATGALAARPGSPLELGWILLLLCVAGILGDAVNYTIGLRVGPKVFSKETSRLLNKKHLLQAQSFYEKYGGMTIVLARFIMPFVRTFAPVVAGAASMSYPHFLAYNIFGGIGWVASMSLLGYFLGEIPWVQHNLEKAVIIVILLSISPMFIHYFMEKRRKGKETREAAGQSAGQPSGPLNPEP